MVDLLWANLFRLKKSRLFWGILILCAALGGFLSLSRFRDHLDYGYAVTLDSVFFLYAIFIGLALAVFIPLFFGVEHSDGTLRNKIGVGHSRRSIYLSDLLTAFLAASAFSAAYMLGCAAVGVPLIGGLTLGLGKVLLYLFGILLLTAAYCALFTLIVLNCGHKAVASVSCILCVLLLFFASVVVYGRLDAQEYYPAYSLTVDGTITEQMEANPRYLRGTERAVYEFIYDLLPTGQSLQYGNMDMARPVRMLLCSLVLFTAAASGGLALFRRKDLK